MKEITIYTADDGKRFDTKEECQRYEVTLGKCNELMSRLSSSKGIISYNVAVQQDKELVKELFREFLLVICKTYFLDCGYNSHDSLFRIIDEVADGTRHVSHIVCVLGDYSGDCPCLYHTLYRFECIDFNTGIEYEQPYFTAHPEEFKGEILKYAKTK